MSFGSIPFGQGTFGGVGYGQTSAPPIGGAPEVEIVIDPFTIEVAGMSMKGYQMVDTLSIDAELGRQGAARFSLMNLWFVPQVGEPVRILFYNDVIFAGAIDRISMESNNQQTFVQYNCECTDNSYLLFRVKIKRTDTNKTVSYIASSLLSGGALAGCTLGTVDNNYVIPMADADGVSAFDYLNGLAVATGTVFSVDHEKRLHFIGPSVPQAAVPLTADNVESCRIEFDREAYRNVMTTRVTGTPATSSTDAVSVSLTRYNDAQLLEREQIERSTGQYSDYASITHPTSNDPVQLTRLANAHNKVLLAVSGSIRRALSLRTRQYGYKAGQAVDVDIPQLGVSGSWIIQRISLREESGRFLITDLQLNQTSLLKRAQELWIDVVRKGTLTILPPISIYSNLSTFTTPGIGSWQVPVGVTEIQVSCYGAGGGGGGGAKSDWPGYGGVNQANGAAGGGGGLVVGVLSVTPGEVLTYWVGAGGTGGPGQYLFESFTFSFGGNGTDGIDSYLKRGSTDLLRAYGGDYGIGGSCRSRPLNSSTFPPGKGGGGTGGQSVTVGGASNGGAGGAGVTYSPGGTGGNGKLVFEW